MKPHIQAASTTDSVTKGGPTFQELWYELGLSSVTRLAQVTPPPQTPDRLPDLLGLQLNNPPKDKQASLSSYCLPRQALSHECTQGNSITESQISISLSHRCAKKQPATKTQPRSHDTRSQDKQTRPHFLWPLLQPSTPDLRELQH